MLRPISKWTLKLESTYSGSPIILSVSVNGSLDEGDSFTLPDLSEYVFYSISDMDSQLLRYEPSLMAVEDEDSDLFRRIRMREESDFDFMMLVPLTKTEISRRRIETGNPLFPFNNLRLKPYLTFNNKDIWVEQNGCTLISGRLQFKSFAGVVRLSFSELITDQQVEVEIITYKLNYEDDFRSLLSELAEFHAELILKLDNPTEVALSLKQAEDVSNQILLLHLRKLMQHEHLPAAIETILSAPYSKTIHEIQWDEPSTVANIDLLEIQHNFLDSSLGMKGTLSRYFCGFTPEMLPEEVTTSTIDTLENRFIKFCLTELEYIVYNLMQKLNKGKFEPSYVFLESCERVLEEYLHQPFFSEIGSFTHLTNSMVLQRRNGYKEMLQYMQQFEMGIQLESEVKDLDTVNGDLRPIHQLYEYWCFFKLVQILEELCGQSSNIANSLIQSTDSGFLLTLKHRVECRIPFNYSGLEIYLYYNRDFRKALENQWEGSYDGGIYHPDFSIKIEHGNAVHWLHFDSKYKIDSKKLKVMLEEEREKGAYKQNDIHTAHAYRDAILGSRGVYILYPDQIVVNDDFIFIRQPDADYPYRIPSIGAFPLRPGSLCDIQIAEIKSYFEKVLNSFADEEVEYHEETGFSY